LCSGGERETFNDFETRLHGRRAAVQQSAAPPERRRFCVDRTAPRPRRRRSRRVIQTFKAEGTLDTRRGSILVRNPEAMRNRSCQCNEAVKAHFEEVLRGVCPGPEKGN